MEISSMIGTFLAFLLTLFVGGVFLRYYNHVIGTIRYLFEKLKSH